MLTPQLLLVSQLACVCLYGVVLQCDNYIEHGVQVLDENSEEFARTFQVNAISLLSDHLAVCTKPSAI